MTISARNVAYVACLALLRPSSAFVAPLSMATTVPRAGPARTSAALKDSFFTAEGPDVSFGSVQTVQAVIPASSVETLERYLRHDPARVVYACWENDRIEPLGDGHFRLRLKERQFLNLRLALSIIVRLWGEDGKIRAQSVSWESEELIRALGSDFAETFNFDMNGELSADLQETKVRSLSFTNTVLNGNVGVTISGVMPPLLAKTPGALVKAACLGINNSVLQYVSEIFISTIAEDYQRWSADAAKQQ